MADRNRIFRAQLEAAVGSQVADRVLGGEPEAAGSSPARQAAWWASAMDRLDALVDEPTRVRVMERCGYACAWKGVAQRIKEARRNSASMDEFWGNLQALYPREVPLERQGFTIYASYTKCYCGRVKATKAPISSTYCHCSKGYFMAAFEWALGRAVRVELLQSIVAGAGTCRFAVHIPEDEFAVG